MRRRQFLWTLLYLIGAWVSAAPGIVAQEAPVVLYLVRHAEKVDDSRDPELSPAGGVRALELARVLRDARISRVWSTDFLRTRHTAEPAASAAGLKVELYDPRDPVGFADQLRHLPGIHLVVGHSNTTPALVTALGGEAGPPIPDSEYDRLYLLVYQDGQVTTAQLRYGAPSGDIGPGMRERP